MPTTPNEPSLESPPATYDVVVQPADLASGIVSTGHDGHLDCFPRVLATSRLVAFMEIAAARVIRPHLGPGQLSVGTRVDVAHTAPTPVGGRVTAEARFVGRKGKLYLFEVSARDDAGEVGRGTHERAVVDTARLESGAQRRRLTALQTSSEQ